MSAHASLISSQPIAPQPEGGIQFSKAGKAKQNTPKSTLNQTNPIYPQDEDPAVKQRGPSSYDHMLTVGGTLENESFLFNAKDGDLADKYPNLVQRLDFRSRDKDTPHKRNSGNFHDLCKIVVPLALATPEISYKYKGETRRLSVEEQVPGMNPQLRFSGSKPRVDFILSKYKSAGKFGFHTHSKNDFEIGKKLGKGTFGDVFLVRHRYTGFLFALKVIPKKCVRQKNIERQLLWEAAINMTLTHPHITQMYGMFYDSQNIYFIEELMTDGHLFNKIKQSKRLPEEEAVPIIRGILEAVEYMHRMSIIHRDLKPENIFMLMGMYKIGDFGWAIYTPDLLRDTFCGTPLYMSPEILKGEKYDQGVDNWALGILTYQLLVGKPPFKISSPEELSKIITQEIKFPQYVSISREAKDFILKLLDKNPQQRLDLDILQQHPFLQTGQVQITGQFKSIIN